MNSTQAEKILFNCYHIKGKATLLPGEIDFNFKIKVDGNSKYILKISPHNTDDNVLDFQKSILHYLSHKNLPIIAPKLIADKTNSFISKITLNNKKTYKVRLLTWIDGRVFSNIQPKLDTLLYSLGKKAGALTNALQEFKHAKAERFFDWDIAQALWIKKYTHLFNVDQKNTITYFLNKFEAFENEYKTLRKSIVHNDANDNNVLVSSDLINPEVIAIIDFGDAIKTQIINDVAITCAYAIMSKNDPLASCLKILEGYHTSFTLKEKELSFLYVLIAIRLLISITKSAINKKENPENKYLQISEKPAWNLLKKWQLISEDFAHYSFRAACKLTAHPNESKFKNWAKNHTFSLTELFPSINKNQIHHLNLSVSSSFAGHQEDFNNLNLFQFKINELQQKVPTKIISGGYLEPRFLYTSNKYNTVGNCGKQSRTIHLGIDFWLPANTPVHALLDGIVVMTVNNNANKDYGGLVILQHQQKNFTFYTLYGHNTVDSILKHKVGNVIKKGEQIAVLANYPENGNWAPHLHFQILLSLLDYKTDFPGVAFLHQIKVWKSICPNPNLLFKLNGFKNNLIDNTDEILNFRKQHLGKSMSLQYQKPLHIVKGANQYLIDNFGKKYLDTVNNVAHVGHENFKVIKAGQNQMALLNTNTRYLHKNITILTQKILKTLPKKLSVLHFVNSGSEANELAIRMLKTYTNSNQIIASEYGYHGNTNACINISSYKFNGKGGKGNPKNTHIFPIPDTFRGKYRGQNAAKKYAKEIEIIINKIQLKNKKVGGFIIEPIISCGGQIELPKGFLKEVYQKIRNAGGICISDEVQTGIGRMGKTFWGFQLHNVIPDIVTIGKPLGNGHPVAAVACTKEVALKFANGMEYFNTFGGNPVSCAIATQVLEEVLNNNLQANALLVGNFLKNELLKLSKKYTIIGNVRGQGLFLGFELVNANLDPLAAKTDYLINRMKYFGILMSSDGPDHNVIKIKPPITFTLENAKEVIFYLKKIFEDDYMKQF